MLCKKCFISRFIYAILDEYIHYLNADTRLIHVFDNKDGHRTHTRKYIGVVFEYNGFKYFAPFSSPKNSD